MQNKLRISSIFLVLLLLILPLTVTTANAMNFELRIQSFGLYCESQNADIQGKVKYVIDENAKAVQYSEYTVKANEALTLYVPFISRAYELAETNITVNGKAVTDRVCYGEKYFYNEELRFYSCDIEDIAGTLYTLTTSSETFTVDFSTLKNQCFIYRLTNSFTGKISSGNCSYTVDNASTDVTYEIFVINGDFEKFESSAETVKETLTAKEYISRHFDDVQTYFSDFGNITPNVLYARINRALKNNINYNYFDFFFDSYSELCVNAYKIELQPHKEHYIISYSMPVVVQKNTDFKPAVYLIEQSAQGNYSVDYTIELNCELPFIIESSKETKRQSEYIYSAESITDNFYFVFSSSEKPESIYGNKDTLTIILYVISAIAVCFLILLGIFMVLHFKKAIK